MASSMACSTSTAVALVPLAIDRNLVSILTHEASNAIALYQKSQRITKLAISIRSGTL